ncbi:hypothetical protein X801_00587 [Opisthorchis viverrini]|uniref:Uncharacterized protein n=2 Tax=Opisthorchis viverrini TaxID=6198 RepID=A0A1S8XAP9_OPIVI|nr:hypothetical protein T265_02655 [Opisthorchis viverrini]KER30970.1 hypothetical protein T265_02655 [Opisthorchis viverrini]OON23503.1 hypothetical protein X801_00587 [Opisthorchis viverrini]
MFGLAIPRLSLTWSASGVHIEYAQVEGRAHIERMSTRARHPQVAGPNAHRKTFLRIVGPIGLDNHVLHRRHNLAVPILNVQQTLGI